MTLAISLQRTVPAAVLRCYVKLERCPIHKLSSVQVCMYRESTYSVYSIYEGCLEFIPCGPE